MNDSRPKTPDLAANDNRNGLADNLFQAFVSLGGVAGLVLRAAIRAIEPYVMYRLPLLIVGESGTGKELVVRAIHAVYKPKSPFIALNCGGVQTSLLESELFGHVRGAFTGAHSNRIGLLEAARDGTVFLDELEDASPEVQNQLLRVVEYNDFRAVGDSKVRTFTGRVICATNQSPSALVTANRLRKDLLFRLQGAEITLPPLRQQSDILVEAFTAFVESYAAEQKCSCPVIAATELEVVLANYDWPGNFRQLNHLAKRAFCVAISRNVIIGGTLVCGLMDAMHDVNVSADPLSAPSLQELKRAVIAADGHLSAAARARGIPRQTLKDIAVRYGIPHRTHTTKGSSRVP